MLIANNVLEFSIQNKEVWHYFFPHFSPEEIINISCVNKFSKRHIKAIKKDNILVREIFKHRVHELSTVDSIYKCVCKNSNKRFFLQGIVLAISQEELTSLWTKGFSSIDIIRLLSTAALNRIQKQENS